MKPRIFVSSTFYDLKYIREDLANFIKAHDFEPILFENGDVGYTPFSSLDDSCYKAIESADMALLIVGGNYGSPATGEIEDEFNEFISVTRREFQKGVEHGIPFFVFIDRNVYTEYGIYDVNSKGIDAGTIKINFRSTKNINVFRFIKEISNFKQIAITEFDKISDIKEFLSKQWSDMFKNYLSTLKEQKEIEKLQDTIANMNVLIEKMDKILAAVGKEVLKDAKEEYKQIIDENKKAEIKTICLLLPKIISISINKEKIKNRRELVRNFLNALKGMYEQIDKLAKEKGFNSEDISVEDANIVTRMFVKTIEDYGMHIKNLKYQIIEDKNIIQPYLSDAENFKQLNSLLCLRPYHYLLFDTIDNKEISNELEKK